MDALGQARISENTRIIIYLSLLTIVVLAVMERLTAGQIYSIGALLLITIIAFANVASLCRSPKKQIN